MLKHDEALLDEHIILAQLWKWGNFSSDRSDRSGLLSIDARNLQTVLISQLASLYPDKLQSGLYLGGFGRVVVYWVRSRQESSDRPEKPPLQLINDFWQVDSSPRSEVPISGEPNATNLSL